jgi:hypothetical protein
MGPIDLILHLAGFVAPAVGLGLLLPLAGRLLLRRHRPYYSFWAQFGLLTAAGVAALSLGLWWFGRDGKMASYGSLVVVTASLQWWMAGGWRR